MIDFQDVTHKQLSAADQKDNEMRAALRAKLFAETSMSMATICGCALAPIEPRPINDIRALTPLGFSTKTGFKPRPPFVDTMRQGSTMLTAATDNMLEKTGHFTSNDGSGQPIWTTCQHAQEMAPALPKTRKRHTNNAELLERS